jgi:hypothetical protein
MVSRFEAANERPDRATHRRYCALAPTEELRQQLASAWDRQLREVHAGRREHLKTWNQLTYDLGAMTRDEHGRLRLDCKLGTYYHSAAIGVSTLTVVRVRNRSFDGYKMFLSPRSVTVAAQRRRYHVVPLGMFQPFIPGESADLLQEQFSVAATAVREFVEELYGVHELETGDGRVDPNAIYRRPEAKLLDGMLKAGDAALLYSGVAVNLLALRHENLHGAGHRGSPLVRARVRGAADL